MLSAKLFASLAILQLGLSLLESKMPQAAIDFYPSWDIFVVFRSPFTYLVRTNQRLLRVSLFHRLLYAAATNNSLAP